MFYFGNDEILRNKSAFLLKAEEDDVHLKYTIELKQDGESEIYEVIFNDYIIHQTRNESFCSFDSSETRNGNIFLIFKKSNLLDCLSTFSLQSLYIFKSLSLLILCVKYCNLSLTIKAIT